MSITKQATLDYVELEWGTYVERFSRLPKEEQGKRVEEMGFESFRDILAHIPVGREEGVCMMAGILDSPACTGQISEAEAIIVEITRKFSAWPEDDLYEHYEGVRLALVERVAGLPKDSFPHKEIESWPVEDIVRHHDEHPILE
jgi:hypothetical protein